MIPSGTHKGEIVDEPEYEGWSGAGWAIGCTEPTDVAWMNTQPTLESSKTLGSVELFYAGYY